MSQMSQEIYDELKPMALSVISGAFTTLGGMVLTETQTDWADDFNTQKELGVKISDLQGEINTLESAAPLINASKQIDTQVGYRQELISELQVQKDDLGNEAVNGLEAYQLSIALGLTVAVVGIRRAIKKTKQTQNL